MIKKFIVAATATVLCAGALCALYHYDVAGLKTLVKLARCEHDDDDFDGIEEE